LANVLPFAVLMLINDVAFSFGKFVAKEKSLID